MLGYEWFLTAPIYGLIGCFKYKMSDFTCPITNTGYWTESGRPEQTINEPIKIKHLKSLANKT